MTAAMGGDYAELVFAPARPWPAGGSRDVAFEMRQLPDGSLVLPVFTSLPLLVEALGHYQPWVCVPLRNARDAVGRRDVARVVTDPPMADSAWRWGEASLLEFAWHEDETREGRR